MRRITKADIEAKIVDEESFTSGTLTIVVLALENGFKIVGKSACVDPSIYDAELGYKIAYDDAFDKVWELEGYLLAERLHEDRAKVSA